MRSKNSDRNDPRRGTISLENLPYYIEKRNAEGFLLPGGFKVTRENLACLLGYESVNSFNSMVGGKFQFLTKDAFELSNLLQVPVDQLVKYIPPKEDEFVEFAKEMVKKNGSKMRMVALTIKFRRQGLTKEEMQEKFREMGLLHDED